MSKMTNNKLALIALGLGAVASGSAYAGGMTVDSKGGLEVFELDDTNYWFKLGGRIFIDEALFNGSHVDRSGFPSGSQIRNARLALKGGVGEKLVYKMDVDFQDLAGRLDRNNPQGFAGRPRFGEVFLGYNPCPQLWFALGQISIPFGLENWASANDGLFMEMALPSSAFSPDFGIGLYGEWHGQMFTLAGAAYQPGAGTTQGLDYTEVGPFGSLPGSDTLGLAGRITFSPIHDDYTAYHAGISARYEDFHDTQNSFNYIAGLEARARQTPVLFSNIPANSSRKHYVWGFELAGRWGPLLMQGEYMLADVKRDADFFLGGNPENLGGNLDYHGYYVAASYVLTGEVRDYDFATGTFGGVHPKSRKGAWEVGVRHSYVKLLDNNALATVGGEDFVGTVYRPVRSPIDMAGSAHSTTVGLTWWVNDNVRLMANYVRADLPADRDPDIIAFRGQVTW